MLSAFETGLANIDEQNKDKNVDDKKSFDFLLFQT